MGDQWSLVDSARGDVAVVALGVEHLLTALHYPRAIWSGPLDQFERLNITQERLDAQLVPQLAAYRRAHTPRLPRVKSEGGCGSGETPIKIHTVPDSARVFLVPQFYYDLCKARTIDPEDVDRCRYWVKSIGGQSLSLSGRYRYQVKWPDRTERRGRFEISGMQTPDITIREK